MVDTEDPMSKNDYVELLIRSVILRKLYIEERHAKESRDFAKQIGWWVGIMSGLYVVKVIINNL